MKVLLVTPHFPPAHVGGVEYYTARLAAWLQSRGCEPEVVSVEQVSTGSEQDVRASVDDGSGYPVHRLEMRVQPKAHGFRLHWRNPALEEWFATLLSRTRPDVLHLQSGYLLGHAALTAARAQRVPAVVTLHDLWFICPRVTMMHPDMNRCSGPDDGAKCAWCLKSEQRRYGLPDKWSGGALGWVARQSLRTWPVRSEAQERSLLARVDRRQRGLLEVLAGAGAVVSLSRFVRDQLERAGFEPGRIQIVPLGIGESRRAPGPRPARPGVLRIGYLGQLAPHKGVHVLIAAVRRLRSSALELRIFGPDQPNVEYVRTLRRLAGGDPRIRFAGAYDNQRVAELLADLDAIVVPSVWHENSPAVVLEAHRGGVPAIASRVGGLPEMIRDEVDGLLFEPGDPVRLAKCLERLIGDPSILPRLRNGIGPVRSEDEEGTELLAIYARAASSLAG